MTAPDFIRTIAFVLGLASASANAADQTLTPDGLGPVRIGMTVREAEKALGVKLKPFNKTDGYSEESCWETHRKDDADPVVVYMIWYGKIVRIAIYRHHDDRRSIPLITTDKGIRIGDTAARVKEVYGPSLKIEVDPQADNEDQGSDLTAFTKNKRRGITIETANGIVVNFRAGLLKATYLSEGCS